MNRKTGVIFSYVLMIAEVLSTLLLTPYIIRTLGDAEYGVYKLSASIAAYLLLMDLGIGNSVIRYVSKYRAEGDKNTCRHFLGITTIYYGAIAGICFVVGIFLVVIYPDVFSKGLSENEIVIGQKLLALTVINVAITLGISGFKNTISAYERFDVLKGSSIVLILIRIVLTLVVLKLGFASIGVVSVNLLITIISAILFIMFVLFGLDIKPIFKGNSKSLIKEIVIYSSFIMLQMIATQINTSLDTVLIGALVSSSAVIITVYSVGQQISQYFQSIGSAVTGVLMPGVVRLVENGATPDQLCNEMVRIGRLIFMVLGIILCGFIIFGRQFITLWVGIDKINAYSVALMFIASFTVILTEAIGTQILWAKNEHKEQSIIKIAVVLINIILTIFLIKWNPLIGASIGTTISLVVGDIGVMNYVFVKKIGINLISYYRGLMKGIMPCLIIALISGYFISLLKFSGWFGFCINIAGMVIIYGLCMIWFGLNDSERKLIFGIFIKRKNKNDFF